MPSNSIRAPWVDRFWDACEDGVDKTITWVGPVFVGLAMLLISLCVFAFFEAVFSEAFRDRTTPAQRAFHGTVGVWVTFNIFFNYAMCVITQPGSTKAVPDAALNQAMPAPTRWCTKCDKPKPDLAHHCSVCKHCVLAMDHHCPWVHNCIGFQNYRYFYLFLFWLTWGCAWSACVLADRYAYRVLPPSWHAFRAPRSVPQVRLAHKFSSLLALLLTACVVPLVGGMLAWHTYLVLTAQGTIDAQRNGAEAAAAARAGIRWRNVYDVGMARNWQERFDARGRLWWVAWLLPRLQRHRGSGYQHPLAKGAEAYLAVSAARL